MNNHDNREEQKESLADLELTTDRAEQTKAGRSSAPAVSEILVTKNLDRA